MLLWCAVPLAATCNLRLGGDWGRGLGLGLGHWESGSLGSPPDGAQTQPQTGRIGPDRRRPLPAQPAAIGCELPARPGLGKGTLSMTPFISPASGGACHLSRTQP